MPQIGLVDAVQHQVGQCDREHQVFLLAAEKSLVLQSFDMRAAGTLAQLPIHVLIGDGQEATCPATGVVHRLTEFGVYGVYHCANHFAWREKLTAIGILLAHLQQ